MIEARQFVEPAKRAGFDFWAGVPCSFLTPFINYTIGDAGLTYISAANEGDAVAAASGAFLGGRKGVAMMQNSGLGNAVSPLTSLNYVFRIPVLLIITLRGEPGRPDEPQHELMGQITPQLLETMQIPWRWFPQEAEDVESVLGAAVQYMNEHQRPFALIMRKGAVAPYALPQVDAIRQISASAPIIAAGPASTIGNVPSRQEVLARLIDHTDTRDTILLASTGFAGRELFAIRDRPNQLYMVGSMGCITSLGLGLSLVCPDKKVVVIDGDGAALMRMGNMATAGAYAGDNYYHLLLDNHVHESTGGQQTVSEAMDFSAIAEACGYRSVIRSHGNIPVDMFLQKGSPALLYIETRQGVPADLPRPSIKPVEVARRLMAHIQPRV